MNILYLISLVAVCIALVWTSVWLRRSRWSWLLLGAAAVLVLLFVNGFVARVPNPFELRRATFDYLRPAPKVVGPLTMPATNADPAAAAARERSLLDEAKTRQREELK